MYSIQEIVEAIDATVLQRSGCERTIRNLCLDSRQVILPDKSVFIALPGIMHDGHIYLKDAHQKGSWSVILLMPFNHSLQCIAANINFR
jgi:UDP-N-acetylmuramyl pentapeptide synthase